MRKINAASTVAVLGSHIGAFLLAARLKQAGFRVIIFPYLAEQHPLDKASDLPLSSGKNLWIGFGQNQSEIQIGTHLLKEIGAEESELKKLFLYNRPPVLGTPFGVMPISSDLNDWKAEWSWCLGEPSLKKAGIFDEIANVDESLTEVLNNLSSQSFRSKVFKKKLRNNLGLFSHSGMTVFQQLRKRKYSESRFSRHFTLQEVQKKLGGSWEELNILKSSLAALGIGNTAVTLSDWISLINLRKGVSQFVGGRIGFENYLLSLGKNLGVEVDVSRSCERLIVRGRKVRGIKVSGDSIPIPVDYLIFAGDFEQAEDVLHDSRKKNSLKEQNWYWRCGIEAETEKSVLPFAFLSRYSGIQWTESHAPPVWIEAHGLENAQKIKISAEVEMSARKEYFEPEIQRGIQRRMRFLLARVFPMFDLKNTKFNPSIDWEYSDSTQNGDLFVGENVPRFLRRYNRSHSSVWMYPQNFVFCGVTDELSLGSFGSILQGLSIYEDLTRYSR